MSDASAIFLGNPDKFQGRDLVVIYSTKRRRGPIDFITESGKEIWLGLKWVAELVEAEGWVLRPNDDVVEVLKNDNAVEYHDGSIVIFPRGCSKITITPAGDNLDLRNIKNSPVELLC